MSFYLNQKEIKVHIFNAIVVLISPLEKNPNLRTMRSTPRQTIIVEVGSANRTTMDREDEISALAEDETDRFRLRRRDIG